MTLYLPYSIFFPLPLPLFPAPFFLLHHHLPLLFSSSSSAAAGAASFFSLFPLLLLLLLFHFHLDSALHLTLPSHFILDPLCSPLPSILTLLPSPPSIHFHHLSVPDFFSILFLCTFLTIPFYFIPFYSLRPPLLPHSFPFLSFPPSFCSLHFFFLNVEYQSWSISVRLWSIKSERFEPGYL